MKRVLGGWIFMLCEEGMRTDREDKRSDRKGEMEQV